MRKAAKTMTLSEHLHAPSKKTIFNQGPAAVLAVGLVAFGIMVIPTGYPMKFVDGEIVPKTAAVGDTVEVHWKQVWSDLCPISVTRELYGSDDFKAPGKTFAVEPPPQKGVKPTDRPLTIPKMAAGEAYYQATIRPHCLWDQLIKQREYKSPKLPLMVVSAPTPGPR